MDCCLSLCTVVGVIWSIINRHEACFPVSALFGSAHYRPSYMHDSGGSASDEEQPLSKAKRLRVKRACNS